MTQELRTIPIDAGRAAVPFDAVLLADSIPQQVWTALPDGSLDYVNRRAVEYFARAAAEIVGEGWQRLVHPEDLPHAAERWAHALATGDPYEVEFRLRRHDGQYLWHVARAVPQRDASGRIIRWYGSNTDIEQQRRAKRAEGDLARLAAIVQSSTDAIYAKTLDGFISAWNPGSERLYGYTAEEMVGLPIQTVVPPDKVEEELEILARIKRGEAVPHVETERVRKDGTRIRVSLTVSPIRDGSGALVGASAIARDMTERLRVEQELREQGERLRAAVDASATGTFRWDLATNALEWDDNLDRLFGLAPGQTARHLDQFTAMVHPDDRAAVGASLERSIREGADFDLEFRVVRPDGAVRWLLDRGQMIRDAQGRALYMTGACTDITLRKRVEEDLRRQSAMLAWQRRVLETAARGAPLHETLDTLCREAHQNAPDHHFTVLLADEDGARLRHGSAPTLPDEYNRAVDGIAIGEGVGSCGTAAFRKTSVLVTDIATDPLWAEFKHLALPIGLRSCWSTPIFGTDGALLGTWAVYRSTTGEPEPEDAELVAVATRLAAMVIERARSEARLRERAEELARLTEALQRSNRELDQFAYITSHDLKAPLRGIANLSRWIEEDSAGVLSEDSKQHLELLRGRVNRMEGLIDAILEYSRVGRVRARPERVPVAPLVADVVDLLAPPEGFRVEVQGELPTVTAERMRLQQVFMNLIGNAVKHHHDKPRGLVTIRAEDAGPRWRFVVSDNGPGIAPRFHEKVFVIFQTLEARDKVEGAGIGLALVKKIVESNGGTVTLDSDAGRGASFSFTWPK